MTVVTATAQPLSKQELEVIWGKFKSNILEHSRILLKTGRKDQNSRLKFLAKVLEQYTVSPKIVVKDISNLHKAFGTEQKMKGVGNSDTADKKIALLWEFLNSEKKNFEETGSEFMKVRYEAICETVGLFQSGDLCFKHKDQVTEYNEKVKLLHKAK